MRLARPECKIHAYFIAYIKRSRSVYINSQRIHKRSNETQSEQKKTTLQRNVKLNKKKHTHTQAIVIFTL